MCRFFEIAKNRDLCDFHFGSCDFSIAIFVVWSLRFCDFCDFDLRDFRGLTGTIAACRCLPPSSAIDHDEFKWCPMAEALQLLDSTSLEIGQLELLEDASTHIATKPAESNEQ